MKKFFGDWDSYNQFVSDCAIYGYEGKGKLPNNFPTEDEILFASCDEDSYAGSASVYFRRGDDIYEYEASHCSCNSYHDDKDNWGELKPVTKQYLINRNSSYGTKEEDKESYKEFVNSL